MPPERPDALAATQAQIVDVLQQGPAAFPENLFGGPPVRALLGLKAHANTISHARLVALEQSFPRTLERLGLERFNAFSRLFIELPQTRSRKLTGIGCGFPDFLQGEGCDVTTVDLSKIEWAWLESYHAADARALTLADLAGLDEPGLLDLPLTLHPACRRIDIRGALAEELGASNAHDGAGAASVLITRPEAVVDLTVLDADLASVAKILMECDRMRNLIEGAIETVGEGNALPGIFALISAGMLAGRDT